MISVTIPGPPQPQGRGRAFRVGAGIRVYDPPASRAWKGAAQWHMLQACRVPLEGPLEVALLAVFACPSSEYLKRGIHARRWHTKGNADLENVVKAALDAGNGILWRDDRQVAVLHAAKIIGAQDEAPGVHVQVCAIETEPGSRELGDDVVDLIDPVALAKEAR